MEVEIEGKHEPTFMNSHLPRPIQLLPPLNFHHTSPSDKSWISSWYYSLRDLLTTWWQVEYISSLSSWKGQQFISLEEIPRNLGTSWIYSKYRFAFSVHRSSARINYLGAHGMPDPRDKIPHNIATHWGTYFSAIDIQVWNWKHHVLYYPEAASHIGYWYDLLKVQVKHHHGGNKLWVGDVIFQDMVSALNQGLYIAQYPTRKNAWVWESRSQSRSGSFHHHPQWPAGRTYASVSVALGYGGLVVFIPKRVQGTQQRCHNLCLGTLASLCPGSSRQEEELPFFQGQLTLLSRKRWGYCLHSGGRQTYVWHMWVPFGISLSNCRNKWTSAATPNLKMLWLSEAPTPRMSIWS